MKHTHNNARARLRRWTPALTITVVAIALHYAIGAAVVAAIALAFLAGCTGNG